MNAQTPGVRSVANVEEVQPLTCRDTGQVASDGHAVCGHSEKVLADPLRPRGAAKVDDFQACDGVGEISVMAGKRDVSDIAASCIAAREPWICRTADVDHEQRI